MSRASFVTVAAVLALLLAGCADKSSGDDGTLAAGLGEIRGVIVDIAVRPIPDVEVRLEPVGANATTDAEGAFLFEWDPLESTCRHASLSIL